LSDNIFLLGFVQEKEKYQLMKKSKMFLFPSHEEGWGIAIVEAMACDACVVVYDVPPFNEIYGKAVMTVKNGDVKDFGEKVVEIIRNDELRNYICKVSRDFADAHDWEIIASREWEYIEKTLTGD
ncbi:MAG: glycosyltransferase family 4 protein, partial [Candidatus Bathyarchaeia archaeon]